MEALDLVTEKTRCVEFFYMSFFGCFEYTEPSQLQLHRGNKYLVPSMCSGVVQPHQTFSKLIVEPTRTHVKELYTPCFLCDEVVREGSRSSRRLNHPELVYKYTPCSSCEDVVREGSVVGH